MIKKYIRLFFPWVAWIYHKAKRKIVRKQLEKKRKQNKIITLDQLIADLKLIGIQENDLLIVHSSLSQMGYVENGAATVVDACFEVLGSGGTLVMPAFAHNTFSKIYLDTNPTFNVLADVSKAGAITEELRRRKNSVRSFHPTDAVTANGPLAEYLVKDHFGQITPYNTFSPYYRLAEKKAKILNIGVPLSTSVTNMHTLEDAVDFKFPIYVKQIYNVKMIDANGKLHIMKTKVHDPVYSEKRRANELLPLFEKEGILKHGKIGDAEATLIDAAGLFEVMVRNYNEKGITMYTPLGGDLKS